MNKIDENIKSNVMKKLRPTLSIEVIDIIVRLLNIIVKLFEGSMIIDC